MGAAGTTTVSSAMVFSGMTTGAYMRKTLAVAVVCLAACVLSRPGIMPARNIGRWFTGARPLLATSRSCPSIGFATPVRSSIARKVVGV
jgi:hypothetical protein